MPPSAALRGAQCYARASPMTKRSCFLFAWGVVVGLAVGAPRARACDTALTAEVGSSCVELSRQGVKGVWFQLVAAEELRMSHRLVPELQLRLEKCTNAETRYSHEAEALRGALQLQRGVSEALRAELADARKEGKEARLTAAAALNDLDRILRSPLVWLSVGALGGALAGMVIASD